MVGERVLETDDGLVNTMLFVPRLIVPEKVVAGRVVGTLLSQVLHPLYRVSNLGLVNFKLEVYKDTSHQKYLQPKAYSSVLPPWLHNNSVLWFVL